MLFIAVKARQLKSGASAPGLGRMENLFIVPNSSASLAPGMQRSGKTTFDGINAPAKRLSFHLSHMRPSARLAQKAFTTNLDINPILLYAHTVK
jgi:hypothetical protein